MDDENKAREFIAVKVLEITKGISDLNQYFYNVEKYQEKNLSAFVKNQSFIKQYELDDEEEQHNIQKIYEVYKPEVETIFQQEAVYPSVKHHKYDILSLVSEKDDDGKYISDPKKTFKYKLRYMAKTFAIPYSRNKIYKILEIIDKEIGNKKMGTNERKE